MSIDARQSTLVHLQAIHHTTVLRRSRAELRQCVWQRSHPWIIVSDLLLLVYGAGLSEDDMNKPQVEHKAYHICIP
jgi:hypothetical protein